MRGRTGWTISGRVRGFSLLEALIASVVLGMTVLALTSAVAAGQRTSIEGQKMVLGSMSASDLLSEASSVPYKELEALDGLTQGVGLMQTLDGGAYPSTYWMVGRRLSVVEEIVTYEELGVSIRGLRLTATAFDEERDLLSLERFIPEPVS